MNHIFKGYKACYDPQFFKQIDSKEEKHEEWQYVTLDQLMLYTNNKFNICKNRGQCDAPDSSEEKIISLQSQLEIIKNKFKNSKGGKLWQNEELLRRKEESRWR